MKLKFDTLDVFTAARFAGNPLAVVHGADDLSTEQMLAIAREFNLSETIFVMRPADAANTARVRIFLTRGEIPFAGHPTVGCAVLLAARKHAPGASFETEIRLEEAAGLVPVKVSSTGGPARAMFTAPVLPFATNGALPTLEQVAQALSLPPEDIGFDGHRIGVFEGGPRFLFVPVKSRDALARAKANAAHWPVVIGGSAAVGAYVYTRGGDSPATNFRARMYAPTAGLTEDPATGAATALLAAQLLQAESLQDGTHAWELEQGYEMGRPSQLHLEADVTSAALTAVRVAGQAVHVMDGVLEF